jgi:hypothetical protein
MCGGPLLIPYSLGFIISLSHIPFHSFSLVRIFHCFPFFIMFAKNHSLDNSYNKKVNIIGM